MGIIRQLQEKYIGKNRKLYFGFVDLEKAFDRVPREVVKWALRKEGVEEWLIKNSDVYICRCKNCGQSSKWLFRRLRGKSRCPPRGSTQPFAFYYCDASNNKACGHRTTMGAAICR